MLALSYSLDHPKYKEKNKKGNKSCLSESGSLKQNNSRNNSESL